jgi:DNA polymerase III sliding clamp (beta) subunit (PCNA family)
VILSSSAATTLSRILKASRDQAVVARQTTDKYDLIRVRAGCFELTTKLPDHQFPPWKQVVPDKGSQETAVIFDVVALNKTLRRVVQLSERGNVKVTVNGVVTLAPWGATLGEAEVITPTLSNNHDVNKPDLELGLDGAYLLDGLPKGADTVQMSFGNALDPVRLDLPDQRLAVIMPLRL